MKHLKSFKSLNENLAMMNRKMKLNDVSLRKFDITSGPDRPGIIKSYMYAAYYKETILIGFNKQMHFLHKQINEFLKDHRFQIDRLMEKAFSIVKEIDKRATITTKYNDIGAASYDKTRFNHRFDKFFRVDIDIANVYFKYENYSCNLKIKAKKGFTEFFYPLTATNIDNYSHHMEIDVDINDLRSSLKMLRLHSFGIFDD